MITLRLVLLAGLLAGLLGAAAPARAEVVRGFPTSSLGMGITMQRSKLAGMTVGSWGPSFDLAFGAARWQVFGEASAMFASLGDDELGGRQLRAGAGVRWLARSFELWRGGSIDMIMEAGSGVSRHTFDGTAAIVRPDLGLGVGYLIRGFYGDHHGAQATLRVSVRVFFAPTDRDRVIAACRGLCPMTETNSNTGMLTMFGGAF